MIANEKLEGLLTAIEAESKSPSPSHQNLARLVTMIFKELLQSIDDMSFKTTYIQSSPPISESVNTDPAPTNVEWIEPTPTMEHIGTTVNGHAEPVEPKKKRKKHK